MTEIERTLKVITPKFIEIEIPMIPQKIAPQPESKYVDLLINKYSRFSMNNIIYI